MLRPYLTTSVALLALALAGCSDEEKSAANEPPAQEAPAEPAPQPAEPSPQERMDEAAKQLRDAARQAGEAAREGADALLQQGREALKDAGPALDRANEIASQIGQSMQEIAERAGRDFDTAIADLEKRLNEAGVVTRPDQGDPAARLSPPDQIRADTRAAAQAHSAGIGPAYVGVWALNPGECGRIDRDAVENFAVITPTTIRRAEAACNFASTEMTEGSATVTASCIAEGEQEERQITFSMPSEDSLSIQTAPVSITVQFVRCHLP
ncbi:hypothetical protein [Mesorhizobium marinum]|uniref:hypothetical protein n=1 Tax=Mesorhizobium marinum TaxID=3228790 RepID=UPI0034665DC2